jgi:bacteriocin-like protein
MSEKEAYDFFKRCQDDKLLGEEIKSILASSEREGFHTTIEELKTIAEKALQKTLPKSSELDEKELALVSGGLSYSCGKDCKAWVWCIACPLISALRKLF